jgi:ferredoxin-fold anticodon binding domain-containing protein
VAKPEAIRITLEQQVGKRVALKLVGGGEVEGMAKKVGPDVVHLAELSGKEFFDAVVRIDQISAVIVRVKTK